MALRYVLHRTVCLRSAVDLHERRPIKGCLLELGVHGQQVDLIEPELLGKGLEGIAVVGPAHHEMEVLDVELHLPGQIPDPGGALDADPGWVREEEHDVHVVGGAPGEVFESSLVVH
ncbi:MAG: hypothetical protein KAS77_08275, partial [Thermoplasmata archaeon]|nr:hypothetical protein [Thermoplasmata archaeon]